MNRTNVAPLAVLVLLAACGPAVQGEGTGEIASTQAPLRAQPKFLRVDRPVPEQYIVALDRAAVAANPEGATGIANSLLRRHGGQLLAAWDDVLVGFSVRVPEAVAMRLAEEDIVRWVEEDAYGTVAATQSDAPWGLDRVDQRNLPLSSTYGYDLSGVGASVYVVDSGIRRTHNDFGTRAFVGYDAIGDGQNTNDCYGHGTHVAGIIGGTTYGVAKGASLFAVRVLNCSGSGTVTQFVNGLSWIRTNRRNPAVVNMSVHYGGSTTVDTAVQDTIDSGVTVVVAAANDASDSCLDSPARVGPAITVGASRSDDWIVGWSNQGSCVDLFAPGVGILSDYYTSDTATTTMSGTSMAAPHTAGLAAVYLGANPSSQPYQVANAIIANATPNVLSGVTAGSPNLLLFSRFVTCAAGFTACSETCVNLSSNDQNCGACGNSCANYGAGYYCSSGTCVEPPPETTCRTGYSDCCGDGVCHSAIYCSKYC